MKKHIFIFIASLILFFQFSAFGQYKVSTYADALQDVVNMYQYNDPFSYTIQYQEATQPDGEEEG